MMYYSKNHAGLVLIDRGMGLLEFSGDGTIAASDTEVWNTVAADWKNGFTTLEMRDGITAIGAGVIVQFPKLAKLILPESVACIRVDAEDGAILRANDVCIHAAYGSYGDAFAHAHGLRLLPEDIELGWYRDEVHDEGAKLVLCFHEDGSMHLLYDIFTAGISAGSSGGASLERPMPEEYHPGCTLEEFAELFPERYHEQIMRNPRVKCFLQREAERGRQRKGDDIWQAAEKN